MGWQECWYTLGPSIAAPVPADLLLQSSQPLHPGGKYYPEGGPRSTGPLEDSEGQGNITADDISKFDNVEESSLLHTKFHTLDVHRDAT